MLHASNLHRTRRGDKEFPSHVFFSYHQCFRGYGPQKLRTCFVDVEQSDQSLRLKVLYSSDHKIQ